MMLAKGNTAGAIASSGCSLLKTTFIGTAEVAEYQKLNEKQLLVQRKQQVKQQEAEQSRRNLQLKKEKEEQDKKQQVLQEKLAEYERKKELLVTLKEQRDLQQKELGLAHRQAQEAEEARQQEEEAKVARRKAFEEKQKERTLKAAEWKRKEEYEKQGKAKEFIQNRQQMLNELQEKERLEAALHREYLENLTPAEIEDPLQYANYERQDTRKGYYANIDFSKTHFHNPIVVKHEDDPDITENAKENAEREFERSQKETLAKMQTMRISRETAEERGEKSLSVLRNQREVRQFSQEMEKVRRDESDAARRRESSNDQRHSERPATANSKDLRKKETVEKAFENQFFGEQAAWTHDEAITTDPEKSAKKSSMLISKNKKEELERKKALEKAMKQQKNLKIFRKPPLDTNVFQRRGTATSQPPSSIQFIPQEPAADQQSKAHLSINNSPTIANGYDSYAISTQQIPAATTSTKRIRFLQPNEEQEEEEYSDRKEFSHQSKQQHQQHSLSATPQQSYSSSSMKKEWYQDDNDDFDESRHHGVSGVKSSGKQPSATPAINGRVIQQTVSPAESSRDNVRAYIREQEEYLKKLEDDRKTIRDRMRKEEDNLVGTLSKATSVMQKSFAAQSEDFDSSEASASNHQGRQQAAFPKYSQSNKASEILDQFMNNSSSQLEERKKQKKNIQWAVEENRDFSDSDDHHSEDARQYQQHLHDASDFTESGRDYNSHRGGMGEEDRLYQTFSPPKGGVTSAAVATFEHDRDFSESNDDGHTALEDDDWNNSSVAAAAAADRRSNILQSNISSSIGKGYNKWSETAKLTSIGKESNASNNLDLSESLFASQNLYSQQKNQKRPQSSNVFQSGTEKKKEKRGGEGGDFSQNSDELSYSLSDIDRSADKPLRYASSGGGPRRQQQPVQREEEYVDRRQGTAKFGDAPLMKSNGISMNIRFEDDEDQSDSSDIANNGPSLADIFARKKGMLARKYQEEQESRNVKAEKAAQQKPERTKEDILRQRKEMMKRPDFLSKTQPADIVAGHRTTAAPASSSNGFMNSFHDPKKLIKEPSSDLMDRLANGTKAKVDKKEYLKLTNKNYDLLPEVRRKKEDEAKKEEYKKRQETVKQLQQNIKDQHGKKRN